MLHDGVNNIVKKQSTQVVYMKIICFYLKGLLRRRFVMSDGGKGSSPRPFSNRKTFEENFDRIFGKKEKSNETDKDKKTSS